jgi:ATP-binding cassette subfamily B protein
MSQGLKAQAPLEFPATSPALPNYPIWLDLLTQVQADLTIAAELAKQSRTQDFQLGDPVLIYTPPNANHDSVPDEQIDRQFAIVGRGRMRVLGQHSEQQREVSVQTLEAGATFGTDHLVWEQPLPYRVVAASDGQVTYLSETGLNALLRQFPHLRSHLQQQAQQREQLIFFKAHTNLLRSGSATKGLTSPQLAALLPYITQFTVPAGTRLTEFPACINGVCWLRQGEIRGNDPQAPPPAIGTSWGMESTVPPDWSAQTDLVIYTLAAPQWDAVRSIAPGWLPETTPTNLASPTPPSRPAIVRPANAPRTSAPLVPLAKPSPPAAASTAKGTIVAFPKPYRRRWFQRRSWRRYPFIAQQSSADCGITCLAMIGQYWGKRFSLNELRNLADVKRTGISLKRLATTAESLGFHAQPVRASLGRLAEQSQPWIAHWQGDHYVVVYRVRGDRILIADPARGKQTLTWQTFLANWTGYALLLDPTQQLKAPASTEQSRSLGEFWGLLGAYRAVIGQIILISLLIQMFGLVTPLFTQVILDQIVVQKSLPTLHVFAIGLVLFSIWRIGLAGVRQYLLDYFSNRLDLTLVSGFISHTLRLPLKFFEARQVGDIITRLQENRKIQHFLIRQVVSIWLDALLAIVYLGLMFYYNAQLTWLVVSLIPPIVLLTLGATPFLKRLSREMFNEAAEQNSLVVEMMTGIATVKAAAAEQEIRWRWEDRLTGLLNVQFKGQKLANGLQIAGGLINAFGSTLLLWYGASLVIQDQLTIGQFVAFNMLIGHVLGPVLAVIGVWDEFQEVLISVERLNDVFATEPEETPAKPMLVLPPIQGEVRFENVTFSYDITSDRNTLQNLMFTVAPGETIAIVGRSGSGKSTLVKLLQALYHPTQGRILIDGHDIRHVSPLSLRSQLGVVPQECFLFSGTILENIQLYRSEFNLEQVIEVAKLAEAHSFIQELTLGYNTKVGERGCNLSGGQRQRVAIARALLGDPAILILDEATSSLDTESERRFQQNLVQISRKRHSCQTPRTTFIIAHRLSTVQNADRILVLDRGVLVEQGTHAELIAQAGLYYHLAHQQLSL